MFSSVGCDSTRVFTQGGSNAVYWAARHGHVDTLKFLSENKCPLDVKDKVRAFSGEEWDRCTRTQGEDSRLGSSCKEFKA